VSCDGIEPDKRLPLSVSGNSDTSIRLQVIHGEAEAGVADVADFQGTAPRSDQCGEGSGEQVA
jgi:hypothetical protein